MNKIAQLGELEFVDKDKRESLKGEISKDIENVQTPDAVGGFINASASLMAGDLKDSNADVGAS